MGYEKFKNKLFLTNKEVAEILRTNADTIRKRIQLGMYEGLYQKEGKYTLWNKQKLFKHFELMAV